MSLTSPFSLEEDAKNYLLAQYSERTQKQSGYSLRHNEPNLHWTKRKHTKTSGFTPGYIINLDSLVAQYIVAAFKFFDEMDTLIEKEKQIVVKRLEKLIDIYDPDDSGDPSKRIEEPKSFKGMHGVLKECDSANPQTEEIRKAICSLFPN